MFLLVLAVGQPVLAQDGVPSTGSDSGQWAPLGELPVDQAGSGRRGYALPGESADVAEPGSHQISVHTVAANNFFREQTDDYLITQRYENHTMAVDVRRGFKDATGPRFELGAQMQFSQRDSGFLNGVISGFETLCLSMSGVQSAKNQLRSNGGAPLPLGAFVTRNGQSIYRAAGSGAGFGDISFVAKALLHDAAPASNGVRVAARVGLNVSGTSEFAEGNFMGLGLSLDKRLLNWAAFHGDVRTSLALDGVSPWNLPLKRRTVGFSAGPELRLSPRQFGQRADRRQQHAVFTNRHARVRQELRQHHDWPGPSFPNPPDQHRLANLRARKHEPAVSRPLEHRSRRLVRHQDHASPSQSLVTSRWSPVEISVRLATWVAGSDF